MIPDRSLQVNFLGNLTCYYKRTDMPIIGAQGSINDNIDYSDFKFAFENGNGDFKANLLYHERYLIAGNTTRRYNLDGGLSNIWGDVLNFDSIKCIIIKNRSTNSSDQLNIFFKDEVLNIGRQGFRIIGEPYGQGINPSNVGPSSDSSEEGNLWIQNEGAEGNPIEYDLIIVGSQSEQSSSSG